MDRKRLVGVVTGVLLSVLCTVPAFASGSTFPGSMLRVLQIPMVLGSAVLAAGAIYHWYMYEISGNLDNERDGMLCAIVAVLGIVVAAVNPIVLKMLGM